MAQEPGSYKVLRYVYATMKRRETREVLSLAARPAVLKRSCADVSFLAGMLVEKFVWHQPLHRQHKRLEASGGYGAYVAYAKVRAGFVTHAQCWSHARRGFEVAQGAEPRLAGQALALIGALYRDEKRIREKGLCGTEKLACRATIAPLASASPLGPDRSCLGPPDGGRLTRRSTLHSPIEPRAPNPNNVAVCPLKLALPFM